jgi:hypothetical protein
LLACGSFRHGTAEHDQTDSPRSQDVPLAELAGKKKASRSPNMVEEDWPELLANWDKIWQRAGGSAR